MKMNFILSIFCAIVAIALLYVTFNENAEFDTGFDKNLSIALTVIAGAAAVYFGMKSNKK